MARLIALKQTAPERFLARFDTGEELRTTLAVVTDFHLRSGKELTSQELDALRAASERDIPGVLLTADGSDTLKQAARERGYRVLTKPARPASLRAFLATVRG